MDCGEDAFYARASSAALASAHARALYNSAFTPEAQRAFSSADGGPGGMGGMGTAGKGDASPASMGPWAAAQYRAKAQSFGTQSASGRPYVMREHTSGPNEEGAARGTSFDLNIPQIPLSEAGTRTYFDSRPGQIMPNPTAQSASSQLAATVLLSGKFSDPFHQMSPQVCKYKPAEVPASSSALHTRRPLMPSFLVTPCAECQPTFLLVTCPETPLPGPLIQAADYASAAPLEAPALPTAAPLSVRRAPMAPHPGPAPVMGCTAAHASPASTGKWAEAQEVGVCDFKRWVGLG